MTTQDFFNDPCKQFSITKDNPYQDIEDKGLGQNLSFEDAAKFAKNARIRSRKIAGESPSLGSEIAKAEGKKYLSEEEMDEYFKTSKCYFLSFDVIQKFIGVPGIDGIRIYKGIAQEPDREMIILVAATNYKGESYDIFKYAYSFYDEWVDVATKDKPQAAPLIALNPCPPPKPCPKANDLNTTK